jgi:hypothetical protein
MPLTAVIIAIRKPHRTGKSRSAGEKNQGFFGDLPYGVQRRASRARREFLRLRRHCASDPTGASPQTRSLATSATGDCCIFPQQIDRPPHSK